MNPKLSDSNRLQFLYFYDLHHDTQKLVNKDIISKRKPPEDAQKYICKYIFIIRLFFLIVVWKNFFVIIFYFENLINASF